MFKPILLVSFVVDCCLKMVHLFIAQQIICLLIQRKLHCASPFLIVLLHKPSSAHQPVCPLTQLLTKMHSQQSNETCNIRHNLMAILLQGGLWACFLAGLAKIKRSCSPKMANITSVTLITLRMLVGVSPTIIAMAQNTGESTCPT